ncbi:MAG: phosphoribosylformylglycinamidine cyclo-ligase [Ignavibacteriales bacterium]|nr:MAG: phosphoribosylformylglycinamidine cyclo-ligase [Ignavibacteriales bacterium]
MEADYKSAGVNIQAGEETVQRIKTHVKSTFNKYVLKDIGHFGAFFEVPVKEYKEPVLVSSVDGVGTKLKIAIAMNKHNTVGQDLVNHCVNDIAVCGARPLYFMDYLAFGKLNPDIAERIIEGFSIACRENGVALIGGETAEMPGMYATDDYDMSGTIVGVVEKSNIIDGKNIKAGDVLVGFPSNGLHTNGYSLARKVLLEKYKLTDTPSLLKSTLGEELLSVHKSYLPLISKIIENVDVKGFSHITGGGIIGNTKRIIPEGLKLEVNWYAWEWLPIFRLIQQAGNIKNEEMYEVFNLGIGLVSVVNEKDAEKVLAISHEMDLTGKVIGKVI